MTDAEITLEPEVHYCRRPDCTCDMLQGKLCSHPMPPKEDALMKPIPYDRVCISDPNNPGARIVGFRIREGDEAWGECGLSEPLFWLDRALSPSPTVRDGVVEECARVAERDGSSHDAPYPHSAEWLHDTGIQVRAADRIAAAIRALSTQEQGNG